MQRKTILVGVSIFILLAALTAIFYFTNNPSFHGRGDYTPVACAGDPTQGSERAAFYHEQSTRQSRSSLFWLCQLPG